MDCVMVDRISYETMKLEYSQAKQRNAELERECHRSRNELELMRKLNDALENIKFNQEKSLQLIRAQCEPQLADTQYDREVMIWHEEYTNIKRMISQLHMSSAVVVNDNTANNNNSGHIVYHITTTTANSNNSGNNNNNNNNVVCVGNDNELTISEDIWDNSVSNDDCNEREVIGEQMFAVCDNQTVNTLGTKKRKPRVKVAQTNDSSNREKRFKCSFTGCSYASDNKGNVQMHYRIHTGEKPFKCTHQGCTYSSSFPGAVKEHMRIHSQSKDFVCDWPECTWRFNTSKLLKNHIRVCHTGDKPHKCDWPGCDKSFLAPNGLRSHKMKHSGERPFKCDFSGCKAAFMTSSDLLRHKRETHCTVKQFHCDYDGCGGKFYRKCDLRHHVRRQHELPPELRIRKRIGRPPKKKVIDSEDNNEKTTVVTRTSGKSAANNVKTPAKKRRVSISDSDDDELDDHMVYERHIRQKTNFVRRPSKNVRNSSNDDNWSDHELTNNNTSGRVIIDLSVAKAKQSK